MNTMRLGVAPNEAGRRLIDFLAAHRKCSRRKAKELLDRRAVFVNGRRIWMAHHLLKANDLIDLPIAPDRQHPAPRTPRILYQDDHYLVADKPAGILANGPHSLETRLQTALGISALTAVHRLDRGTSGCLLFAKDADAQKRILPLFTERKIRKIYHALVVGMIRESRLTIAKPIEGQSAATDIQVLAANRQASHLRIVIRTGRTHQIRKHLLSIGHPIFGDPYYAIRRKAGPLELRLQRPMLHAFQLGFTHPFSGAAIQCAAPLPADFLQGLAWLRLEQTVGFRPSRLL